MTWQQGGRTEGQGDALWGWDGQNWNHRVTKSSFFIWGGTLNVKGMWQTCWLWARERLRNGVSWDDGREMSLGSSECFVTSWGSPWDPLLTEHMPTYLREALRSRACRESRPPSVSRQQPRYPVQVAVANVTAETGDTEKGKGTIQVGLREVSTGTGEQWRCSII